MRFGTTYNRLCTRGILLALALSVFLCFSCSRGGRSRVREAAYISAPQAFLRDQVAAVYQKRGIVKNGERVEILERDRRFAHVRTAAGVDGWIEQRYLVTQKVYDGFQKLAHDEESSPIQALAITRNDTNMHLTSGRDTEHLYLITQGSKVSVLRRSTAEKRLPGVSPKSATQAPNAPAPVVEDWWLIRNEQGRIGWVLARMVDIDVPLEVAQYAEGQRIVAAFVLNEVADKEKKVPQYLMVLSEPKDGMPFDFNQIRVFTWNVRRHRYETAYRERLSNGVLPVTVTHENFEKEGDLPVFLLRVKDDAGNISERKYKLNTPIVRRVFAPGEEKNPRASRRTK